MEPVKEIIRNNDKIQNPSHVIEVIFPLCCSFPWCVWAQSTSWTRKMTVPSPHQPVPPLPWWAPPKWCLRPSRPSGLHRCPAVKSSSSWMRTVPRTAVFAWQIGYVQCQCSKGKYSSITKYIYQKPCYGLQSTYLKRIAWLKLLCIAHYIKSVFT